MESSRVWWHVPATGPIAWGWSVIAVILSPTPLALTWIAVASSRTAHVAALVTTLWVSAGLLLCAVPRRIARGLGLGMAAAAVTWGVVLLAASRIP